MRTIAGVEITQDAVKFALAERRGKTVRVLDCGRVPLSGGATPGQVVADMRDEGRLPTDHLRITLGTQKSHLKILTLPPMPRADLAKALHIEVERELEVFPEELTYTHEVLPHLGGRSPQRILLALTPRRGIVELEGDCAVHGLRPEVITLGSLALLTHIRRAMPSADATGAIGVLHLEAQTAVLAIVEAGTLRLVREIAQGVSTQLFADGAAGEPAETAEEDALDLLSRSLSEIGKIAEQIRKTLEYDRRAHAGQPVAAFFLAGDVTRAKEMAPILENEIRMPVRLLDPLAGLAAHDLDAARVEEGPVYALPLALVAADTASRIPSLGSPHSATREVKKLWRGAAATWAAGIASAVVLSLAADHLGAAREAVDFLETRDEAEMSEAHDVPTPLALLEELGGWSGALPIQRLARVSELLPRGAKLSELSLDRRGEHMELRLQGEIRDRESERRLEIFNHLLAQLEQEPGVGDVIACPVEGAMPAGSDAFPFDLTVEVSLP